MFLSQHSIFSALLPSVEKHVKKHVRFVGKNKTNENINNGNRSWSDVVKYQPQNTEQQVDENSKYKGLENGRNETNILIKLK